MTGVHQKTGHIAHETISNVLKKRQTKKKTLPHNFCHNDLPGKTIKVDKKQL